MAAEKKLLLCFKKNEKKNEKQFYTMDKFNSEFLAWLSENIRRLQVLLYVPD